jgi:acyl-CoA synthetase (AMP-forming)/AMP-acid ligase II
MIEPADADHLCGMRSRPLQNGLYPDRPVFNVHRGERRTSMALNPANVSYRQVHGAGDGTGGYVATEGDTVRAFRVMLLLENRPEFFIWLLALNRIGASAVPVNPDLQPCRADLHGRTRRAVADRRRFRTRCGRPLLRQPAMRGYPSR